MSKNSIKESLSDAERALRAYTSSERGVDSEGHSFASFDGAIADLERKMSAASGTGDGEAATLAHALSYWNGQEASVSGMLGGLDDLDAIDVRSSKAFLASLTLPAPRVALDVGAGIGRVTLHVLAPTCVRVDLVEPVSSLLDASESFLASVSDRIGHRFAVPLQSLDLLLTSPSSPISTSSPTSPPQLYSLVWLQWAALYVLRDSALVRALVTCASLLAPRGVLVVKENVTRMGRGFVTDASDASVTRAPNHWAHLFKAANLKVIRDERVKDFPTALFPVAMWALTRANEDEGQGHDAQPTSTKV